MTKNILKTVINGIEIKCRANGNIFEVLATANGCTIRRAPYLTLEGARRRYNVLINEAENGTL